jgi:structure-specific recognition protein 1
VQLLAAKNEKCGNKLAKTMAGPIYDVFARTLSGLSGSKISRANTGVYSNAAGDGVGIRCSYKADDGYLYPMKHSFIYVHKPPLLIQHQDIDTAEFQRQGGGVISSSVRTFDLSIKVKNNNQVRGLKLPQHPHCAGLRVWIEV